MVSQDIIDVAIDTFATSGTDVVPLEVDQLFEEFHRRRSALAGFRQDLFGLRLLK
jgi:hypothetical protein